LLDCDVEQPNAHLFMHPVFESTETVTVPVPEIDMGKCTCRIVDAPPGTSCPVIETMKRADFVLLVT
jgi:MinD superfamily P-loop ATPase